MIEIAKPKHLAFVLALFGCLLIIAALFSVDDITKFRVTPRTQVFLPALAAGIALVGVALVFGYFIERQKMLPDVSRRLPNRNLYFVEILHQIDIAERQILMCVHTLKPAEPGNEIEKLHQSLAARARNLEIKILAPGGEERTRASYQLAQLGISIRHLHVLEHLDVSFSLFDSSRVVLPTESGNAEETVAGITVKSTKLVELLRGSFEDLWWRFDALSYSNFVRYTVNAILPNTPLMPLEALAERLKIPRQELTKLLPAFEMQEDPNYFFIIGRPASGKTTISEKLIRRFERLGIQRNQICYFNDYEVLYERFVGDVSRQTFEEVEYGGFAVRDFSVLDIVLRQANFELTAGKGFFRIFIVEFARESYLKAILNFDQHILEKARVIHVKSDIDTCVKRNNERRAVASDRRSGYVPEKILREFYAIENLSGIHEALGIPIEEIDTEKLELSALDDLLEEMISQ